MAKLVFDDKTLRRLRNEAPGSGRGEWSDMLLPGLRFRVTAAGHSSFSVLYRLRGSGEQVRETIGAYPLVSLSKARQQARQILLTVADGQDPRKARRVPPKQLTVAGLFDLYMERHVLARKHKRPKHVSQKLKKDVLPYIGDLPLAEVTRAHMIDIADRCVARGAPLTGTNVIDVASGMFKWAMSRDLMAHNPCYLVQRPGRVTPGERVLSDPEIQALWAYLTERMDEQAEVSRLVLLSRLLLGQRTSEVTRMEWSALDLDAASVPRWWNLAKSITKNKRPHRVFLPPLWVEHVYPQAQALQAEGGRFVFPSPRRTGAPVAEGTVSAACQRLAKPGAIGFHFTTRDLRRTYVTRLAKLGVPREVRKRLVNHVESGVDAVHYNLYDYDKEVEAAVRLFNAHLVRLLFGAAELAEVVPLRSA